MGEGGPLKDRKGETSAIATLNISVLNTRRAKQSCHYSHCVTSDVAASDLALEDSLIQPHVCSTHRGSRVATWSDAKTLSNLQTLAIGHTHLPYHPACSWPKAQTPVKPALASLAEESLRGAGRLSLSLVYLGTKSSHRAYHRASAPNALDIIVNGNSHKRKRKRRRRRSTDLFYSTAR